MQGARREVRERTFVRETESLADLGELLKGGLPHGLLVNHVVLAEFVKEPRINDPGNHVVHTEEKPQKHKEASRHHTLS